MTTRPRVNPHTMATVGDVTPDDNGMRDFLLVLRRALLLIVEYIEGKYGLRARRS